MSNTPAAAKADVEADEATKVGQSGKPDEEIQGAQGSVHTAEDTLHQHTTDRKVDADEAANVAQAPEGCQDPVTDSCESPTITQCIVLSVSQTLTSSDKTYSLANLCGCTL